jgi:hypothetical protein
MTILNEIKTLKYTDAVSSSFNTLIQSKLITLFYKLCHIDEETLVAGFSDLFSGIGSIHASFKYATVDITCKEEHIKVVFYFKGDQFIEQIPVGSQELVVITDEDMNYKSATFKSAFSFGTPNQKGTLCIDRLVDSHFNTTTSLSYAISSYGFDVFRFHLKHEHLPKIYLTNDNNFYTPFFKMIDYCFYQSEIFYSVFDGYPSHKDILTSDDEFKRFLRLYNNDYKNGKKLLKSKISLLDMQAI